MKGFTVPPSRRHPLGTNLVTVSTDTPVTQQITQSPLTVLLLGAALGAGIVTLIFTWKR
jgi:hypothetical protein